ncbi:MAG: hypothetical protein FWD78_13365 [Treponema sp.]|nr:hypothetical protein [Treponema sp.]
MTESWKKVYFGMGGPLVGDKLVTIKETSLTEDESGKQEIIKLPPDTHVKFLGNGETITKNGLDAPMYFIETEDGMSGFCFAGDLE